MHGSPFVVPINLLLCLSLAAGSKSVRGETKPGFVGTSRASAGSARSAPTRAITAKSVLSKAVEKARAWQSDADLGQVETDYADGDGKIPVSTDPSMAGVTRWEFVFSSARTKGALRVLTDGGQYLETQDASKEHPTGSSIAGDFVDSDLAMAEARKNGYSPSASGNSMFLAREYVFIGDGAPQKFPEPVWIVGSPGDDQFVVSAKTGKFMSKHHGP